ncbi:hypothetical protein SNE40_003565 [Patella caerulea]|uniref:C2H2-type domain-containing protein n=1 Tax=Patella caerulea TaxID=87958 RepID=A0AAN8KGQ7_PATCE
MDETLPEFSDPKCKVVNENMHNSFQGCIANGISSNGSSSNTGEDRKSDFSNDSVWDISIHSENSTDGKPADDGNAADISNNISCSDIDVMTDAYRDVCSGINQNPINKPVNLYPNSAERDQDEKINPVDSKDKESEACENYLMSIKKRCKKKVGRRDKHLVSNPLNSQRFNTSVNGNNNNSTNNNGFDYSANESQDDILRDYLMCLYGEEAFTFTNNGSVSDTNYYGMEEGSCSSNSEGFKSKSLKNKFEYRKDCTESKPYICGICSKAFGQHSNIVLHMRSHTGEKPYICDVCGKGFSGKSDLNRHKNIHSVVKKYWCEECQRGFNDNSGFRRHKLIYHSASSHKCHICPKSYLALKDLDKHLKTHLKDKKESSGSVKATAAKSDDVSKPVSETSQAESDVKDDTAITIDDSSTDNSNLTGSVTNGETNSPPSPKILKKKASEKYSYPLHTLSPERPHQCEKCNFSCSKRSNLRKHVAYVHCAERFYKCDVCLKGFKSSWALKRHKQVHNEEKTYRCDICEKGFNDTGSFKYHMKTHSGEKPHHCEVCAKSFVLKSDLKKHMSTHIKQIQVAADRQEVNEDMEVLIQSDDSFLNLAAYVQSSGR